MKWVVPDNLQLLIQLFCCRYRLGIDFAINPVIHHIQQLLYFYIKLELSKELVPIRHNKCSTNTCQRILDAIARDNVKKDDYQSERDVVTKGIVSDIKHYNEQFKLVDEELEKLYFKMGYTLHTIPGVNVTTAVKILSEIGDINRFPNADKLAQFAGIAPLKLSSAGKGKDRASKQGNRRLQATIYFLAIQDD